MNRFTILVFGVLFVSTKTTCLFAAEEPVTEPLRSMLALAFEPPKWLVVKGPFIPDGGIRINYLEAYCRSGSTEADWEKHTVIPHKCELLSLSEDRQTLRLRDTLADGAVVEHTIAAGEDEVEFRLTAHNPTDTPSEAEWAQACVRLAGFTGFASDGPNLDDYLPQCFLFLGGKLARMSEIHPWAKEARYTPGQVWCPAKVPRTDVNPRPLSPLAPDNGLIGAYSADGKTIFATAWEPYQELFQGIARCLHSDLRIGGLRSGETKQIRGKIYLMNNDIPALLARYARDFPEHHPIRLASSSSLLQLKLEADRESARIVQLGWDTEGTHREHINLLRLPAELRLIRGGKIADLRARVELPNSETVRYCFPLPEEKQIVWEIAAQPDRLRMAFSSNGDISKHVDRMELFFPFDPTTAVSCVIGSNWTTEGKFALPAILSAPDLGQMLMTQNGPVQLSGRIEGSRSEKWVNVTLELPVSPEAMTTSVEFAPVVLQKPAGFADERQWKAARRGWFNLIQLSCGASGGSKEVAGVWANNVLSDPVSSVLYMLVDATLLIPELAPGITMAPILRRTVEYWIDHKTNEDGLIAYTARGTPGRETGSGQEMDLTGNQNVMDANPSVLIGAWGYVKASGDIEWLKERIKDLEFISGYMERHDTDGDGLIESKQSGNSGSRPPRDPDCAWDCYTSGHKNAYVNTLAYRAWRGLADLEHLLGRTEQEHRYQQRAEQLKAAFLPAFFNPKTGWLGFWRSRDGVLHDIYSDAPASFAINYGLIEKDDGREMLEKYWCALKETGFARFDLGVPICLRPIPREEMEAYFDFEQFLNGGCCVSNTSYLLNALYIVGMETEADLVLEAMLKRQEEGTFQNGGGFQNGFVDRSGLGAEVFDWKGNPAGYEGHLVYCWSFLHSMLLREPTLRERVYGNLF